MDKRKALLDVFRDLWPDGRFDHCSENMNCFGCIYSSVGNEGWFCKKTGVQVSDAVVRGAECPSFAPRCSDVEKCWDAVVSVVAPLFGDERKNIELWAIRLYMMRRLSSCSLSEITRKFSDEASKIARLWSVLYLIDKVEQKIKGDATYKEKLREIEAEICDKLCGGSDCR